MKTVISKSNVYVSADETGNIVRVFEGNPEYGYISIKQSVQSINADGWVSNQIRSCQIKGKVEDLITFNYKDGQVLPGHIVIKEALTPFNQNNPSANLKIAGSTGVICRVDDEPIYRQSVYTTDMNMSDELIDHTNSEEIKEALNAQKELIKMGIFSQTTL